jgi:chromate transporter
VEFGWTPHGGRFGRMLLAIVAQPPHFVKTMLARLAEIAALFLKLGTIGFGGPAVHIATMEEEVVERRKWLSREHFLDLVGATNLIPGPNSTEMAIHIGFVRGGWPGLIVAGVSFIVPAVLITAVFAWIYVEYGHTPQIEPILMGIKPAVLAIIFSAGWRLGKKAVRNWTAATILTAVTAGSLWGMSEIPLLLAGGILGMFWIRWTKPPPGKPPDNGKNSAAGAIVGLAVAGTARGAKAASVATAASATALTAASGAASAAPAAASLGQLALLFLKVGAVLYGSGYVLIAYLQGELVTQRGWLTDEQLVDAVAIGQFTPGPILSTATFIGYVVMAQSGGHRSGMFGAAVATLCIFLPSFVLVAATNPFVPKLRKSRWTAAFLDAVNAASLGLMAAVTVKLAYQVFRLSLIPPAVNWPALLIATIATAVVFRWKISAAWIVLGGATAGVLVAWLGWSS